MAAPRKDNVRDIILDTTEILLNNHSIDNLSLANICKEAGVSKGTLYYHYKTKEDILLDLTDRYLKQQEKDLAAWIDDPTKDTSLHRMVKYVIERDVYETGPRFHLIYNACIGNENVREKVVERYMMFEQIIADKIASRVKDIEPLYLSQLLLVLSDGLLIQKELNNANFDIKKFIEETAKITSYVERKQ